MDEEKPKFGYYEKRLCILLFLSSIPNGFPVLQTIATNFTPPHHCAVDDVLSQAYSKFKGENISSDLRDRVLNYTIPWEKNDAGELRRSSCFRYNVSDFPESMLLTNTTVYNNDSILVRCNSMYYDGIEVSAATEFNMICERSWLKAIVTSAVFCGMLLGSAVAGYVTDRYGRRNSFLIFTFWQYIFGFLISLSWNFTWYTLFQAATGIGNLVNYMIATVIGVEMIHPKYRAFTYFLLTLGYSVGYALLAPLFYFFRDWRWLTRATSLVGILYIPYFWMIDESPKWLVSSGRKEEAAAILRKIAKLNNENVKAVEDVEISEGKNIKALGTWKTILKLGKHPTLIKRVVIICLSWFLVAFSYYLLSLNNNNLVGNRFLNMFLSSLTDFFSAFVFYVAVQKRGRRETCIWSGTILGLCIAAIGVFHQRNGTVILVVSLVAKFMVALDWAAVVTYTLELFPTKIRQSTLMMGGIFGKVGSAVSPYALEASKSGNALASCLLTSSLILLSSGLFLFLPETNNVSLPQTVQDALRMRSSIGCCQSQKKTKKQDAMFCNKEQILDQNVTFNLF